MRRVPPLGESRGTTAAATLQSPPYKRPSSLDASARARAVRAARPGPNVSKAALFFFAAESARASDDNYTLTRPLAPASLAAHDAATLHHAAEEGDDLLIRALINIGANVNEADSEGQTPSWRPPRGATPARSGSWSRRERRSSTPRTTVETPRSRGGARTRSRRSANFSISVPIKTRVTRRHAAAHRVAQGPQGGGEAAHRCAPPSQEKNPDAGRVTSPVAAAANGSTECLQDLIDAGSNLRHSASESSLRGGSATALELAEESKQPGRRRRCYATPPCLSLRSTWMWGKPDA